MVCRGGAEESEVSEELRSFASILVEGALVELEGEDSGEADMYRSQSGIIFGFTADLRSR
jgi:hypothetical protein